MIEHKITTFEAIEDVHDIRLNPPPKNQGCIDWTDYEPSRTIRSPLGVFRIKRAKFGDTWYSVPERLWPTLKKLKQGDQVKIYYTTQTKIKAFKYWRTGETSTYKNITSIIQIK